jgi:FMN phosphatase YigB (HAD superfamily)
VASRVTRSSEVGVFKPDEKIFRAVIEKFDEDLSFGDVLFVTENREHVIETRRLGMHAIHFKGPGQNAGDVDRLVDVIPKVPEFLGLRTNGGNRTRG